MGVGTDSVCSFVTAGRDGGVFVAAGFFGIIFLKISSSLSLSLPNKEVAMTRFGTAVGAVDVVGADTVGVTFCGVELTGKILERSSSSSSKKDELLAPEFSLLTTVAGTVGEVMTETDTFGPIVAAVDGTVEDVTAGEATGTTAGAFGAMGWLEKRSSSSSSIGGFWTCETFLPAVLLVENKSSSSSLDSNRNDRPLDPPFVGLMGAALGRIDD